MCLCMHYDTIVGSDNRQHSSKLSTRSQLCSLFVKFVSLEFSAHYIHISGNNNWKLLWFLINAVCRCARPTIGVSAFHTLSQHYKWRPATLATLTNLQTIKLICIHTVCRCYFFSLFSVPFSVQVAMAIVCENHWNETFARFFLPFLLLGIRIYMTIFSCSSANLLEDLVLLARL